MDCKIVSCRSLQTCSIDLHLRHFPVLTSRGQNAPTRISWKAVYYYCGGLALFKPGLWLQSACCKSDPICNLSAQQPDLATPAALEPETCSVKRQGKVFKSNPNAAGSLGLGGVVCVCVCVFTTWSSLLQTTWWYTRKMTSSGIAPKDIEVVHLCIPICGGMLN